MIHQGVLKRLRFQRGRGNMIGLIAGIIGFIFSLPLRSLFPGKLLGDPLPIMLTPNHIIRSGFLYIQWRPLLMHILFLLLLISVVRGISILLPTIQRDHGWFVRATRVAVLLNVLIAALFEVDSIMVGFWYIVSGYLSVTIATFIAGRIARKSYSQHP